VDIPEPGVWAQAFGKLLRVVRVYALSSGFKLVVYATSYFEWVQHFNSRRRKLLDKRYEVMRGVCPNWKSPSKSFVKVELLPKCSEPDYDPDFDPRLIQGTHLDTQILTGPWIYAFSCYLHEVLFTPTSRICYAAGMSLAGLGQWFTRAIQLARGASGNFFCYVSDMSRFDGTIPVAALLEEIRFYKLFHAPNDVLRVLKHHLSQIGITRHGVFYKIPGGRQSGDNNTSCGNSLINIAYHLGVIGCFDDRMSMIVMGDDCVVVSPYRISSLEEPDSRRFGLNQKVFVTQVPTFCSKILIRAMVCEEIVYVAVPLIGRVLAKSGWCRNPLCGVDATGWVGAVGEAYRGDWGDAPVLRSLAQLYVRSGSKPDYTYFEASYFTGQAPYTRSPETYYDLECHYGCHRDVFDDLDDVISRIKRAPAMLDHPAVKLLTSKDVPTDFDDYMADAFNLRSLSVLYTLILAPIVEEAMKRVAFYGVPLVYLILLMELFQGLYHFTIVLPVHLLLLYFGYWDAVLLHSMYNLCALASRS